MANDILGILAIILALLFIISAIMTVYYALKRNQTILNSPEGQTMIKKIMHQYPYARQQRLAMQNKFRINMIEAILLLRGYRKMQ